MTKDRAGNLQATVPGLKRRCNANVSRRKRFVLIAVLLGLGASHAPWAQAARGVNPAAARANVARLEAKRG